jgi:hypothetical protein
MSVAVAREAAGSHECPRHADDPFSGSDAAAGRFACGEHGEIGVEMHAEDLA